MAGVDATNLVGRVRRGSLGLGGSLGLLGRHDEIWVGLLLLCVGLKVSTMIGVELELKMLSTDGGTSILIVWVVLVDEERRERSEGREGIRGRRARSRHVAVFIYAKVGGARRNTISKPQLRLFFFLIETRTTSLLPEFTFTFTRHLLLLA